VNSIKINIESNWCPERERKRKEIIMTVVPKPVIIVWVKANL